jgi:hypothetical protein
MGGELKFLAVGLLVKDGGEFAVGKHKILASAVVAQDDHEVKNYRTHIKQIMDKAGAKLSPEKRIRLTADGNNYDLHVMMTHPPYGTPGKPEAERLAQEIPIVFFLVTDDSFTKNTSMQQLFADFKEGFFSANHGVDLTKLKNKSPSKENKVMFDRLIAKYSVSKLAQVSAKVDAVKGVMKDNVQRALSNVEDLELMENKSGLLEQEGKQFQKSATKVKKRMKWDYYKVTALVIVILLLIVAIVLAALFARH